MTKKKLSETGVIPLDSITSPFQNAYLHFLKLSFKVPQDSSDEVAIDANEKALFEFLMLKWHAGHPIPVRQAINMSLFGSPSTLHKRLVKLRKAGYLTLQGVPTDRRIKLLVPALQGFRFFEEQGKNLFAVKRAHKKPSTPAFQKHP
jgi:hypothetical protein